MPTLTLDKFDRLLLELLQDNADLSAEQMAAKIGRSPSAVQRRVKRLKQSGAIESIIAVVNPGMLESRTLFVVGLELERERAELLARLRAWIRDENSVQQAYYVTGAWDVLLMIALPGISDFDTFMAQMLTENPNIRRFSTHVVLSVQKRGVITPLKTD